ncbi:MAG: hypothetical protein WA172_07090 [Terriglobales bacterium]
MLSAAGHEEEPLAVAVAQAGGAVVVDVGFRGLGYGELRESGSHAE